jgi:MtN3 and saliva related transmembrane protein
VLVAAGGARHPPQGYPRDFAGDNIVFASGILLWLIYGIAIGNWPLIAANAVSMVLTLIIIAMKLRYG